MTISDLVEDSTLLVQVAELLSGGGVSRALLNKTITVNVSGIQESGKCRKPHCPYLYERLYHIPSSCMVVMVHVIKVVKLVPTFNTPIVGMEYETDSRKLQISMLSSQIDS